MTTDYDLIVDIYEKSANHPIKRFCEGAAFQQMLGNMQGQSALDLACGDGFYTRLIQQAGAISIVGIDLSKEMIGRAIAQQDQTLSTIDYRVADVTTVGHIGLFDCVTAVYLLPYADTVENLVGMFQTIASNLKSGGRFVGITMNPDLAEADLLAYRQYGITMAASDVLRDKTPITFTVTFPDKSSFSVETTHWGRPTYEWAAGRAGLRNLCWHDIGVSSQGYQQFDADFWQPYATKPYSAMLTCMK